MGTGVTIFIFLLFLKPRASQSVTTTKAATTSDAQSSSRNSTVTSSRLIDSSIQSTSASVGTMSTSTTTAGTTLMTTTIATTTGITTTNSTRQNTLTSVANMSTPIMVTVITSTTTATTKIYSPTTSTTRATTGITITKTQLTPEQSTFKSNSIGASTNTTQVDMTTKFPMNMSNNGTYSSIETSLTKTTMLTTLTPTTILMTAMQSGEEKTTNATMSLLNTNPLSTIPNGNDSQTKIPAVTSTVSQVASESTNRTTIVSATLSSKDEKKEKELGYDRDLVIIFGTMVSLMLVAGISYGIFKCNRRRKNRQFMEGGGSIHIATSQL